MSLHPSSSLHISFSSLWPRLDFILRLGRTNAGPQRDTDLDAVLYTWERTHASLIVMSENSPRGTDSFLCHHEKGMCLVGHLPVKPNAIWYNSSAINCLCKDNNVPSHYLLFEVVICSLHHPLTVTSVINRPTMGQGCLKWGRKLPDPSSRKTCWNELKRFYHKADMPFMFCDLSRQTTQSLDAGRQGTDKKQSWKPKYMKHKIQNEKRLA